MTSARARAALPIVPFALYSAYSAGRGELRVDHLLLLGSVVLFTVLGRRARELFAGLYPFALVALLYDAMRPFQRLGLTESRVALCNLRDLESTLFGWEAGGQRFTLHDFFLRHHAPALDLFCAVPYATFILWSVVGAIILYRRDRPAMRRFAWGWFLLNVAGFATYHLVPAAPPWYFHAHGCRVDLATAATEGPVLTRVDAMLGVSFFHGMYARASSVFGALPSLHCAYPLLLVLEGWRSFGRPMRVAAVSYWLAMLFSAVYLDHHWVLDALLGAAYAVAASACVRALQAKLELGTRSMILQGFQGSPSRGE
jgi:hypothetical protein